MVREREEQGQGRSGVLDRIDSLSGAPKAKKAAPAAAPAKKAAAPVKKAAPAKKAPAAAKKPAAATSKMTPDAGGHRRRQGQEGLVGGPPGPPARSSA